MEGTPTTFLLVCTLFHTNTSVALRRLQPATATVALAAIAVGKTLRYRPASRRCWRQRTVLEDAAADWR
jgi:hypothetical protein